MPHVPLQLRVNAVRRIATIALALGEERTRTELLPFLKGAPLLTHEHACARGGLCTLTFDSLCFCACLLCLLVVDNLQEEDEIRLAVAEEVRTLTHTQRTERGGGMR